MAGNQTLSAATIPSVLDTNILDSIKWPYWIVAIGHIIYSFGYIAVNYLPHKMPSKYCNAQI
jgi:hypothetical protein